MNIKLQHLLPANISDEAAFHIVKFVNDLALALESIYFEQMLHHSSRCEYASFTDKEGEENEQPF
jgi:hypothetical protein